MPTKREGRWDCSYCGKSQLGRNKTCTQCGRTRSSDVKFYLPDNAPEVTDAKQLEQANAGPDWYCEYCGASNANQVNLCKQCGASRGSSPSHLVTDHYHTDSVHVLPTPLIVANSTQEDIPQRNKYDPKKIILIGISFLVGLILAILLYPRSLTVVVDGFSWQRTITVEQYRAITEQGWSTPQDARNITSHLEIHHYDSVLDHYETRTRQVCNQTQTGNESYTCGSRDLGNGYFEDIECDRPTYSTQCRDESYQEPIYRQEPRYAPRYTYTVDRWVFSHTLQLGENNKVAKWPMFQPQQNERESKRTEQYLVIFIDQEGVNQYRYTCDYDEWVTFTEGEQVNIKVNTVGMVSVVDKAQPKGE